MSARLKRCDRCGRRMRTLAAMAGWNLVVKSGYITELLCPSCQTPEEHAEAAINEATLDFAVINGRLAGSPKGGRLTAEPRRRLDAEDLPFRPRPPG